MQVHLADPIIDVLFVVRNDPEVCRILPGFHVAEPVRATVNPITFIILTQIVWSHQ